MMLASLDDQRVAAEPHLSGAHCPGCGADMIAKCGEIVSWHWAHKIGADCDTWAERDTQWHLDWQARFPLDSCEIPIGNHRADVRSPDGLVIEFQHSSLSPAEIREREDHYGRMVWVFDAVEAFVTDRLNLRCKQPDCNLRYGVSGYGWYLIDPHHPCCADDDASIRCDRPAKECPTRRWHQRRGMTPGPWRRSPGRGWHRQLRGGQGPDKSHCCDTLAEPDPYRSFRWKHPRLSLLACRRQVYLDLGGGYLLELRKLYPEPPHGGWGYLRTGEQFLDHLCEGLEYTLG